MSRLTNLLGDKPKFSPAPTLYFADPNRCISEFFPSDSNAVRRPAPRPNDVSLDNTKARRVLDTPMRSLTDGLELVLECKERQEHG